MAEVYTFLFSSMDILDSCAVEIEKAQQSMRVETVVARGRKLVIRKSDLLPNEEKSGTRT